MEQTSILTRRCCCSCYNFPNISSHFSFTFSNQLPRSNDITLRTCNASKFASVSSAHRISAVAAPADVVSETGLHAKESMPKIDKSGRFCSPRAARELALTILYASCLEGSDPIRLFEKRLNARREPGYEFNKDALLEYNHMSFGGPPVLAKTIEEEDELLRKYDQETATEAEVLSAPPKLVYSKLVLRFTRKLLVAVLDKWDSHVAAINRVVPPKWQVQPASKILELSILHLAMAEISVVGTRHPIVINEAVDLAKRYCDGTAPRTINGCLRTFVKELTGTAETALSPVLNANEKVPAEV